MPLNHVVLAALRKAVELAGEGIMADLEDTVVLRERRMLFVHLQSFVVVVDRVMLKEVLMVGNIGALYIIIRPGFWGPFYYSYHKDPPPPKKNVYIYIY